MSAAVGFKPAVGGGAEQESTGRRIRRRLVRAGAAMGGVGLLACAGATHYVAWRLGQHPALGEPLVWNIRAPWAVFEWSRQGWPGAVQAFNEARAGALLFVTLAGCGFIMAAERSKRKPKPHLDVHGTARWATERECREAKLLPAKRGAAAEGKGLYIGAWDHADGSREYIRHSGPEHLLGIGPLRSGKTQGLAVTNLLTWLDGALVNDPKGELWEATAGWRKVHAGNTVIRWAPGEAGETARYNFLDEVRLGTPSEFGDVSTIIEAVADPTAAGVDGKDHWTPVAAELLVGVTLFNMHERRAKAMPPACLADTRRALQDPDRTADQLVEAMVKNRLGPDGRRHNGIAEIGQAQLNRSDRERTSVTSTAGRMMRLFADPVVARNTSRSDFRIADLMDRERPVSLYMVVAEDRMQQLRPLTRLFLATAMARLMSAPMPAGGGKPHKHDLLIVADEFPAYGKMNDFVDRLSRCAGYGIRALLLAQSYRQILDNYGRHEAVTGQCHVQVFHTPNDQDTAELMSAIGGRTTVITEDVSESGARGGSGRGYNRAYHTVSRPLLAADEARRLRTPAKDAEGRITAPGQVMIGVAGRFPILGVQSLYFLDDAFKARAAIPAPPTDRLKA